MALLAHAVLFAFCWLGSPAAPKATGPVGGVEDWSGLLGLSLVLSPGSSSASSSDERVSELAKRIKKERDKVDPSVFEELARIGGAEAFDALERALDQLKRQEPLAAAFEAFQFFAPDKELSLRAANLIDGPARRTSGRVALAATRALIGLGEPAIPGLEDLIQFEKADPEARALACDALVPLLSKRGDSDSLRTILSFASLSQRSDMTYVGALPPQRSKAQWEAGFPRSHRAVVRDILKSRTSPDDIGVLSEFLGAPDTTRAWRLLLIEILSMRDDEVITQGLARALETKDADIQMAALEALEGRGEWKDLEPHLRGLLKAREPGVRRAAVAAMGRHGLLDSDWRAEMLKLSKSRDPAIRMGATTGLVEMRTSAAIERLHAMASDKSWSVRLEVWQKLGEMRLKESVPVLIERFLIEKGRFTEDLHAVLRGLTGIELGPDPARWQKWWQTEGARFQLPSYAEALAAEEQRRGGPKREGGTSVKSFFGRHIASERVVFVLDISGSMRIAAKGADRSRSNLDLTESTRLSVAKEQLSAVLRRLPDETLFNVIFFETNVIPFSKKLVKMRKKSRQQVLRFIDEQIAAGSTALYPALKLAFEDELVDTIYLLSDGAPTEGAITDIAVIRQEVKRWNSHRRVKIHGTTVGQDSTLLHWLTEDTGGRYIRID